MSLISLRGQHHWISPTVFTLNLGHGYAGAKVGGRLVHLDYELKNGEIVELLPARTRKGPGPEWLDISKDQDNRGYYLFTRTRQARRKIYSWFNKQKSKEQS